MTPTDPTRPPENCGHQRIERFTPPDAGFALWACGDCKLRFYPACRTCVDVGHRNVDHPAERAALPEVVTDKDAEIARLGRELERCDGNLSLAADELNRLLAERAAQPSAALRELAARIRAEQAALPVAVIEPGEVLATLPDGRLLTERQRGSLRGQGAALSWVLNQIDTMLAQPAPAPTPVEPPMDDLGAEDSRG